MNHNPILKRIPKSTILLFICTFLLSFTSNGQICPPPDAGKFNY